MSRFHQPRHGHQGHHDHHDHHGYQGHQSPGNYYNHRHQNHNETSGEEDYEHERHSNAHENRRNRSKKKKKQPHQHQHQHHQHHQQHQLDLWSYPPHLQHHVHSVSPSFTSATVSPLTSNTISPLVTHRFHETVPSVDQLLATPDKSSTVQARYAGAHHFVIEGRIQALAADGLEGYLLVEKLLYRLEALAHPIPISGPDAAQLKRSNPTLLYFHHFLHDVRVPHMLKKGDAIYAVILLTDGIIQSKMTSAHMQQPQNTANLVSSSSSSSGVAQSPSDILIPDILWIELKSPSGNARTSPAPSTSPAPKLITVYATVCPPSTHHPADALTYVRLPFPSYAKFHLIPAESRALTPGTLVRVEIVDAKQKSCRLLEIIPRVSTPTLLLSSSSSSSSSESSTAAARETTVNEHFFHYAGRYCFTWAESSPLFRQHPFYQDIVNSSASAATKEQRSLFESVYHRGQKMKTEESLYVEYKAAVDADWSLLSQPHKQPHLPPSFLSSIDHYTNAFLNTLNDVHPERNARKYGGTLVFGVDDETLSVIGIPLTSKDRDKIEAILAGNIFKNCTPQLSSARHYKLTFIPVLQSIHHLNKERALHEGICPYQQDKLRQKQPLQGRGNQQQTQHNQHRVHAGAGGSENTLKDISMRRAKL